LLHLVGATDVQIARLFQRRTAWEVSLGAVLGAAIAVAIAVTVGAMTSGVSSGLVTEAAGPPLRWLWMLAVPPAIILVATFAARRAVIAVLKGMP
jgi:cell division transport system permease protein